MAFDGLFPSHNQGLNLCTMTLTSLMDLCGTLRLETNRGVRCCLRKTKAENSTALFSYMSYREVQMWSHNVHIQTWHNSNSEMKLLPGKAPEKILLDEPNDQSEINNPNFYF